MTASNEPESDEEASATEGGDRPEGSTATPDSPGPREFPEPGATEATFGMDPALAAAMADADASYSQRKAEASGEAFPVEADDGAGAGAGDENEIVVEAKPSRAPPLPSGAGEGVVRALAQLRETLEKLEQVEAEKAQAEAALLRARADLENYKKRAAREVEQERKFANEALLKDLLPVVDNLERAIAATEGATLEQYASGVEMVEKSFIAALARFGVEQFTTEGEPFDPERMEAMQQMEVADRPPGTVIQEFMKGYLLKGRLVRPAMVIVAAAPMGAETAPAADSPEGQISERGEIEAGPTPTTSEEDATAAPSSGDEDSADAEPDRGNA